MAADSRQPPAETPPQDGDADAGGDNLPRASSADFVQSFERGLAVIRAFGEDRSQLTLSDVARSTGITRAAARRFLHTLVELGYVRSDGRYFSLRPKILELGYAFLSGLSMHEIALPHLEALAKAVNESTYLTVLDEDETVCVAYVPVRRIWTFSTVPGTRLPAFATAAGRVILAAQEQAWLDRFFASVTMQPITRYTLTDAARLKRELEVVAAQGWALVDHELEEGLRTVASPVRDESGVVVAAVSFSTLIPLAEEAPPGDELVRQLLGASAAIEADLRLLSQSTARPQSPRVRTPA